MKPTAAETTDRAPGGDVTPSASATAAEHQVVAGEVGTSSWFEILTNNIVDAILVFALLAELVVMFGSVVARYVFKAPFLGADDLGALSLGVLTFIGGAAALRRGRHISIQILIRRLPGSVAAVTRIFGDWVILLTSVELVLLSIPKLQLGLNSQSTTLSIPGWVATAPLTIGCALMAAYSIERLVRHGWFAAIKVGVPVLFALVLFWLTESSWIGYFDPGTTLVATLLLLLVLIVLGVPIGFVFAIVAYSDLTFGVGLPTTVIPDQMLVSSSSIIILSVPFFILAGYILTDGGLSTALAEFVRQLIGHYRGGFLQVCVVTMYLFSGISGSKVADVAAVASAMKKSREREGYSPGEFAAVLAASAVMGETVPPSIMMLVLGSVTSLSIASLFVAGLVPATFVALCLMVLIYIQARRSGRRKAARPPFRSVAESAVRAVPALLLPLILFGGIVKGVGSPTEVSSFAVVYGLIASAVIYRGVNAGGFWRMVVETATLTGMVLFTVSTASAFSWTLTVSEVPQNVAVLLNNFAHGQLGFLLISLVALLVFGSLLEGLPALLIFGPLLLPIAPSFGVNPLQFGIVMILAMGFGAFSPPLGIGLYVTSAICEAPIESTVRRLWPYLVVLLLAIVLVALVPWLSIALPGAFHMSIT